MEEPYRLAPGATIGILGGGQLGRMLAIAAARLGLRSHIYCPDPDSPAFDVSAAHTVADYDDQAALKVFAGASEAVTVEFENVPAAALEALAGLRPVRPGGASLRVCQDRLEEKRLTARLGIAAAEWREVDGPGDVASAIDTLGGSALLKARRLGYDGKGQARIARDSDPERAWREVGAVPAIAEAVVPFEREVSVVAVRGTDGAFAAYDPVENLHLRGILHRSRVPARISPDTAVAAQDIARRIAEALDHVGVMAVEMFVVREAEGERLLVNEIAPRVHNSGHWTIEACAASQFEAHMRAVAGWPLPSTARHSDAEMTNLIGDDSLGWLELAAEPGAALHLYGKREARPGRKMGHVTRLWPPGDLD